MNYAEIKYCDIANGSGVRTSLFVSGCTHRCKGCFNAIAWDFNYGMPFDETVKEKILKSCEPDYVTGLSLLGGEPFEPENQRELVLLVKDFKKRFPGKTIWCFSGYTYEQLTGLISCGARIDVTDDMLACIDVLVDGKFEEDKRDITLRFRGSGNQRIIDLKASLERQCPVLWQDDPGYSSHRI